jgi:hypothetical protein
MTRVPGQIGRLIDAVEGLTLVQVGQPTGRWSWFQITWAGLHAAALVMHALSVLYHARRVVCTEQDEPLFVAGCPARHESSTISPVSLLARRTERADEARTAAS